MFKKIYSLLILFMIVLLSSCANNKTNSIKTNNTTINETTTIEEEEKQKVEYIDLFVDNKIKEINPSESEAHIKVEKNAYVSNDTINITCYNCDEKDVVGLFPYGGYPQDMEPLSVVDIDNSNTVSLTMAEFKSETKYLIYLYDSKKYTVLDYKEITIVNSSDKDYKVKSASYEYKDGVMTLTITPPTSALLTYEIYWAKNNKRLEGYSYVKSFKKGSSKTFTYTFDKYIVMPDEANGMEIKVTNGNSTSVFIDVNDGPKLNSKYLYSFNVLTDIHIQTFDIKPNHVEHLENALNDIYNYNKNSKFLVSVGDQTDTGAIQDYECVTGLFNIYKKASNVPVYYCLGNHEYMYSTTYENQIEVFKKYANVSDTFYTVTLEGSTLIFMASDVKTTAGGMNEERLEWLKNELDKADKTKQIFIFLHQPLINTSAGSLENQHWYGINNLGKRIENLLEDYKNVFLFTGHTHWEMESNSNIFVTTTGQSYINCASVGYLWNDEDKGEPGSEGYFVDVYEDSIVIRGREFTKGEWLAYATYRIPLI